MYSTKAQLESYILKGIIFLFVHVTEYRIGSSITISKMIPKLSKGFLLFLWTTTNQMRRKSESLRVT